MEKYRRAKARITNGEFKINDIDFRTCDNCRDGFKHSCKYIIKNGYPKWCCGFCELNIKKGLDMEYKIAIDADSLINIAMYREPEDIEAQYFEFCSEIGKIKGAVFNGLHDYEKGDKVIAKIILTPNTNFRYDIYPEYKANRPPRSEERKALMRLVYQRLDKWTEIHKNVEADDVVIYYAKQGWMVAAIDKDVKNGCPTHCYDYKKYSWNPPRTEEAIEGWYLIQALTGDSVDNIKGAKGIGEKTAFKIIDEMYSKDFANIIQYFDSYEDALLSMRLVRMDQWNGEEVVLWEPPTQEALI